MALRPCTVMLPRCVASTVLLRLPAPPKPPSPNTSVGFEVSLLPWMPPLMLMPPLPPPPPSDCAKKPMALAPTAEMSVVALAFTAPAAPPSPPKPPMPAVMTPSMRDAAGDVHAAIAAAAADGLRTHAEALVAHRAHIRRRDIESHGAGVTAAAAKTTHAQRE